MRPSTLSLILIHIIVIVTCIGPKDISRREDFSLDGCLKVDLRWCGRSTAIFRAIVKCLFRVNTRFRIKNPNFDCGLRN